MVHLKIVAYFVAAIVLAIGLGVQIWGIVLIANHQPNPMLMLSWVVPVIMSAHYLWKRHAD